MSIQLELAERAIEKKYIQKVIIWTSKFIPSLYNLYIV